MNTEQKLEELERRIRELEARPVGLGPIAAAPYWFGQGCSVRPHRTFTYVEVTHDRR